MAFEIMNKEGETIRVGLRGTLRPAELRELQDLARDLIVNGKRPRILVIVEDFEGWETREDWGDVDFLMEYGDDIAKIAIVGDERWREEAFLFTGKGLRTTAIEFFPSESLNEAEAWLAG
ncbi:MAG: STAS/SEC14 domain-containing protein [Gammaproteobacteria bacterium]